MFARTIQRDLIVYFRNKGDLLNPLTFLVIVVSLFPLGISPGAATLQSIAPGVVWVAALLSMMLSMDMMFRSDFDDGSLEQMALSPTSLIVLVAGKITAHWLVTGLPIALLTPLFALLLFVPGDGMIAMFGSLMLGTPILSLLGAVGASLTVGLKRGGLLLAILILPLSVPVLILATEMIKAGMGGADIAGFALWLAALLALTTAFAPLAASAGVRIAIAQ